MCRECNSQKKALQRNIQKLRARTQMYPQKTTSVSTMYPQKNESVPTENKPVSTPYNPVSTNILTPRQQLIEDRHRIIEAIMQKSAPVETMADFEDAEVMSLKDEVPDRYI